MKVLEYHIRGIKCDAKGCDYTDDDARFEQYPEYLNKPCPKCGGNLLTEADIELCHAMIKAADVLNYFVGDVPVTPEMMKSVVPLSVEMDGRGKKGLKIKVKKQP